jgi:phosphotransferase system enzyme I (PtsI)
MQLRALLRAQCKGNIKVMFPMISGVEELREARAVLEEAKEELRATGQDFNPELPCGVTLEVPSAATTADLLAREADFFSIGTNDLIQYCLAVDRGNEQVSHLYEPFHPAILRTIRYVIDSGHKEGIKVGMCGEMAADPLLVVLLVGLELDELSMNAMSIPAVKNITRSLSAEEAREIADRALQLPTTREVAEFVAERMDKRLPDGLYYRSY